MIKKFLSGFAANGNVRDQGLREAQMDNMASISPNNLVNEETVLDLPPKIARHCRSPRRIPKFSEDSEDIPNVAGVEALDTGKYSTKQSQRLPFWVWFCIAKALGIPLHPRDKPIFATILHILTFGSALTFITSQTWFIAYDIASVKSKQDILSGSVSILIALMWTSLGLYAKSLSGRLFRHPRFLKDIRMHARTIFKINAAFLAFLLGLFFIVLQDLESVPLLNTKTCEKVELEVIVCQIQFFARVIFSVFSLIWNTLVAIVLISLCRTHTIGIRRFVRELELDALAYDHYHAQEFKVDPMTKEDVCEETFWLEEDSSLICEEDNRFMLVHRKPKSPTSSSNLNSSEDSAQSTASSSLSDQNVASPLSNTSKMRSQSDSEIEMRSDINEEIKEETYIRRKPRHSSVEPSKFVPILSGNCEENTGDNISVPPHTMTTAEILHKYWKLSCRLRVTSCALQRWMASLISLVIVWCFIYLIHWQDHTPTVQDVLLFVVPLLLLPLLCSAFAEVNMEGNRMVQCICPTEERLQVIRFLCQNPLNMMIFGVSMSYGTIMTVVFAIFVAFTSRLIFAEMSKSQS